MALRTIVYITALGFFSAVFPAKLLPMPYGAVIGGVAFGVLLAAYLWTDDKKSWDLVMVPVALGFALPFAALSTLPVVIFAAWMTNGIYDGGAMNLLMIFCMGTSGALLVLATFVWFHLGQPIKRQMGLLSSCAAVAGVASLFAYRSAGLPDANALLSSAQPQLMVVWQTSVAVMLGFLKVAETDRDETDVSSCTQASDSR